MKRIQNVTLFEAYELVKVNSFVLWVASGNYMDIEKLKEEEHVETRVILGASIFLLALSVEREGIKYMTREIDLIDIWPSVKTKYPQLFNEEVKGEVWIIP